MSRRVMGEGKRERKEGKKETKGRGEKKRRGQGREKEGIASDKLPDNSTFKNLMVRMLCFKTLC